MTSIHREYSLDSRKYNKITGGAKTILITTHDSIISNFTPDETIVFTDSNNPYRSIMVNIESIITAGSLGKLYEYYSIRRNVKNNPYIVLDDDYTDNAYNQVTGIKFSISKYNRRALQEIILPFSEVKKFIANSLPKDNLPEANEWFQLYFDEKIDDQEQSSLNKIIGRIDGWISDFVFELTIEYRDKIGYDEEKDGSIEQYLDRSFSVYEFFPITKWWDETRSSIVRYFCGEYPYLTDECHYYTIFD